MSLRILKKKTFTSGLIAFILLISCYGIASEDNSSGQILYHSIMLSAATLDSLAVKHAFPSADLITCVIHAKHISESTLPCYKDLTCSLYDAKIPNHFSEDIVDGTTCYTTLDKVCVWDNVIYQFGDTIHNEECRTVVCDENFRHCSQGYTFVPSVGCINVQIPRSAVNYDSAKTDCIGLGGQLAVPDNFEMLRQYLECKDYSNGLWVGIEDNKWTDGRIVEPESWYNGVVPTESGCGFIAPGEGFKLIPAICTGTHRFICSQITNGLN